MTSPADAKTRLCTGGGIGFVGGDEEEDFIDVVLIDGDFVMGGGHEDQDLEVGDASA